MSITLTNNAEIQALNKRWRGLDEATDVLSFPDGDEYNEEGRRKKEEGIRVNAGDIVISVETLHENAEYFHVDELEELHRLIVHGILHLSGRDHQTNDPSESMLQEQEKILNICSRGS
jgi:probable rRNA maturation factor